MATAEGEGGAAAMPVGYPMEWEFDGLLMNGEAVVVRPIQPADAPAVVGLAAAARSCEVDYDARMVFVAVVSDERAGLGSDHRLEEPGPAVEARVIVTGTYQRHGVATLLFESRPEDARTRGIPRVNAEGRAWNANM